MGINIGEAHAGRDVNVTMFHGFPVPNDWRMKAIEAMAGLNPRDREAVDAKTIQLSREIQDHARPDVMRRIFDSIKELAPAVAQVIAAAMPWILRM